MFAPLLFRTEQPWFYTVYNTLGYGFLEKVYENALIIELEKLGFRVEQQQDITVYYNNTPVGKYFADIVVNGVIILELKTVDELNESHKAQLINYLKATNKEVGLLLNFAKKPQVKRVIFTNDRKKI
ncbi:MAG TPA: GxxExxY protein [Chloroflexi bacterium]|nr:GxxExxY protein [Chloroflexota bacterium]